MSTDKSELVRKIKAVMDETGLHESERMKLSRELDARGIAPLRGGTWGENSSKLGNFWKINKRLLDLDEQSAKPDHVPQERTDIVQRAQPELVLGEPMPVLQTGDEYNSTQPLTEEAVTHDHTCGIQPQDIEVIPEKDTLIIQSTEPEPVTREYAEAHDVICETPAHSSIQLDPKDHADLTELLIWWRTKRGELTTVVSTAQERPLFKRDKTVTKTVRLSDTMAKAAEKYAARHRAQTGGTFSGLCEWLIWQALGRPEKFVTQVNIE